jgi:DNA-binding CsgD family transcriptional regulator/tetratricopeptide (TPR) repeat protein
LSPDQILQRLDDAFRLLVGGSRTAPTRQQTLKTTLDWSFQLLAPRTQHRFECLAVFAGGFDLEAAEAIWSGLPRPAEDDPDALEVLTELVDRSLVVAQARHARHDGMRYRFLEPVRQYAQRRLTERGDWQARWTGHANYFVSLAERAELGLRGSDQMEWVARLHLEHDNLRAALRRCLDAGEVETALRMGSALAHFWRLAGFRNEGRHWIEEGLSHAAEVTPRVRAKAWHGAAELAYAQGDFRGSRACFEHALELWRAAGDQVGVAAALPQYGRILARMARTPDEYREALVIQQQAVAANRQLDQAFWAAWALLLLGNSHWEHAELESAAATLGEAEAIFRQLGESHLHGHAVFMVGAVLRDQGDLGRARTLIEESLASSRAIECVNGTAESLYHLALLSRLTGDPLLAVRQGVESLILHDSLCNLGEVASCVELLGGLALDQGEPERTLRLYAGAMTVREEIGVPIPPIMWPARERELNAARGALASRRSASGWATDARMSIDELVEYARQTPVEPAQPPKAAADPLSTREREVIKLLARGYTNRQIEAELIISERTADGHVAHILAKLGLATRSAAAVWAVEHAAPPA